MNPIRVMEMLGELAVLKFFPAGSTDVLKALARMCGQMCQSEAQVRWLVDRMTGGLYTEWPGPAEMRACFCSRFRPNDGISVCSGVYPEGIPSERASEPWRSAIGTSERKLIGGSPEEPMCPESAAIIKELAIQMPMMPAARSYDSNDKFSQLLKLTLTAPSDRPELPPPTPQIITQADVDALIAKRREKA